MGKVFSVRVEETKRRVWRNEPDYMVGGKGGKRERGARSVARRPFPFARATLDPSELAPGAPLPCVAREEDSSP